MMAALRRWLRGEPEPEVQEANEEYLEAARRAQLAAEQSSRASRRARAKIVSMTAPSQAADVIRRVEGVVSILGRQHADPPN